MGITLYRSFAFVYPGVLLQNQLNSAEFSKLTKQSSLC